MILPEEARKTILYKLTALEINVDHFEIFYTELAAKEKLPPCESIISKLTSVREYNAIVAYLRSSNVIADNGNLIPDAAKLFKARYDLEDKLWEEVLERQREINMEQQNRFRARSRVLSGNSGGFAPCQDRYLGSTGGFAPCRD